MSWLHRLQQRLSITRNEALTLLSLCLFLLLGTAGRYACRQMQPFSPDFYAKSDRLFAERSAAVLDPPENDPALNGAAAPESTAAVSADSTALQTAALPDNDTRRRRTAPGPLHVDLNQATSEELQQLPRIGPRMAERIIAFREQYGPLKSVDELLSVSGIGPKTLEQIRPSAYVGEEK